VGLDGKRHLFTEGSGIFSNNGSIAVTPAPGTTVTSQLPIQNIANSASQSLSLGRFNVTGLTSGASIYQSYGRTIIDQGTTLGVSAGFMMVGGNLYTNGSGTATINGDRSVAGGQVVLNGLQNNAIGRLNLAGSGNLNLYGGTLVEKVDLFNLASDLITTSGNIEISVEATLQVNTFNIPQDGVGNTSIAFMSTGRGSMIGGDFGFKFLDFNDGSGRVWNTQINQLPNNNGYAYLLTYQPPA
jgi:hypothetical protein